MQETPPAGGLKTLSEYDLRYEAVQEWGRWLSSLVNWEWFLTLTFRPKLISHLSLGGQSAFAETAWQRFCAMVNNRGTSMLWCRAFEMQKNTGNIHIHALLGRTAIQTFKPFSRMLWQEFGMNRWKVYNPSLGAAHYLSKYVIKDLGDIKLMLDDDYSRLALEQKQLASPILEGEAVYRTAVNPVELPPWSGWLHENPFRDV